MRGGTDKWPLRNSTVKFRWGAKPVLYVGNPPKIVTRPARGLARLTQKLAHGNFWPEMGIASSSWRQDDNPLVLRGRSDLQSRAPGRRFPRTSH